MGYDVAYEKTLRGGMFNKMHLWVVFGNRRKSLHDASSCVLFLIYSCFTQG